MGSFEQALLNTALSIKDAYAKALASYLFREVIEEAHVKYNITQADMKDMCKMAVNRAALFLKISEDPALYRAFAIHAVEGIEWDDAEETDDTRSEIATLKTIG